MAEIIYGPILSFDDDGLLYPTPSLVSHLSANWIFGLNRGRMYLPTRMFLAWQKIPSLAAALFLHHCRLTRQTAHENQTWSQQRRSSQIWIVACIEDGPRESQILREVQ